MIGDNIQEEIENKIIDDINFGVGGRLIIFKPEKKGWEDYLAVEKRGDYKKGQIYFQVNSFVIPSKDKIFIKDFPEEDFTAAQNFYLLFVFFDEMSQKIGDYIWLVPSLEFRDIAETIKTPDGRRFLRFQSSGDIKNKNQYSKFIINSKNLGDLILEAFETGGKINLANALQGTPLEEKNIINLESLKDFLITARKNTYPSGSGAQDNPRLIGSKQFEFQKADYYYRDIYFSGDKSFIGQEIIYKNLKPVWGMNYIGSSIGKIEENFLKESLIKLAEKCRMGQTCQYEKREYKYIDKGEGTLERFLGKEEILVNAKSIYRLNYEGGLISEKI